jgi:hypothetical protein
VSIPFFFLWLIVLPLRRRQQLSPQSALRSGPKYYFVCGKGDCSLSCKKYTLPISIVQSIGIWFLQFCTLHMLLIFSVGYTYVSARSTVEPWFTNKSVHEQIFQTKKSRVWNGVSSNEHASWQQRLATNWEYRRKSVSCCVTFAQYTSLLELAMPSLEFHCVL